MDDKILLTTLIGLGIALVLGYLTARSSHRRDPLYGGAMSHFFHYIGAGLFVSLLPVVLVSIIFTHIGTGSLFLVLVGFVLVSYVALLIHATFERPARAAALAAVQERGWTEEDARTSGL